MADCINDSPPKVKQEKVDSEIERILEKTVAPSTQVKVEISDEENDDSPSDAEASGKTEEEQEDKKNVEPMKSSNDLIAELFQVFKQLPPKTLLTKEHKKQRKHKKEKKSRKHKSQGSPSDKSEKHDEDEGQVISEGELPESKEKGKQKKKKKKDDKEKKRHKEKKHGKHKKSKSRERSKERRGETHHIQIKVKNKSDGETTTTVTMHCKDEPKRKRPADTDIDVKTKEQPPSKRPYNSFYDGFEDEYKKRRGERHRSHEKSRAEDAKDKLHGSERSEKDKGKPSATSSHRNDRYREGRNEIEEEIRLKIEKAFKPKDQSNCDSEISLSDEETYLQKRARDLAPHRSHHSRGDSSSQRSRSRRYTPDRRRRERTRSRSNSRARALGIDKKRLLEIARKNAITMFKKSNLPGCVNMTEEVKDKVLLQMRYGGRTVQDLTEFCRKISNGEHLSELSSNDEGGDSDVDKNGNPKAFNHPFQIREREPIVMQIRNSKAIAPAIKKSDDPKAITMQYPVSSGQHHRLTEAWVPVEAKPALAPLPALPAASQATSVFKSTSTPKNIFAKPLPAAEEQQPAFALCGNSGNATVARAPSPAIDAALSTDPQPVAPPPVPPPQLQTSAPNCQLSTATSGNPPEPVPAPFVPDVPIPSTAGESFFAANNRVVFPQINAPRIDVAEIITKRLSAMRRLQENPMDLEARYLIYNSQKQMSDWSASKLTPGQFTGSTGANILTQHELNAGPQAWARRDQLTSTQPITGGMGERLLQKMGWRPGEGLGRCKSGSLQPLLLDIKLDKRGLVAREDNGRPGQNNFPRCPNQGNKRRGGNSIAQAQQNLEDKHPVSLLNELASKRKWTPPFYNLMSESGPSHNRQFQFSVLFNGQNYTPPQTANTKKDAKMLAAKFCLQQIGFLPHN